MNDETYLWLALGLVPYYIARKRLPGGTRHLEIRALFWSLELRQRRRKGSRDWKVRIPLITRLRDIIWAIVLQLKAEPSEKNETPGDELPQSSQNN